MPDTAVVTDTEFLFAHDDGTPGEFDMLPDVVAPQAVEGFLQAAGEQAEGEHFF